MRAITRFLLVSAVTLLAACGSDESELTVDGGEPVQLAEGDVRITSRDGAIDLMLLGDRIAVGLSDSTLNEIRRETDTSTLESSGGIGSTIERFVKSKVQSTLAKRIDYPLTDVRDVRYEKGRIVFDYEEGAKFSLLENAESDGVPVLANFAEADAKRFVDAVKTRLR